MTRNGGIAFIHLQVGTISNNMRPSTTPLALYQERVTRPSLMNLSSYCSFVRSTYNIGIARNMHQWPISGGPDIGLVPGHG